MVTYSIIVVLRAPHNPSESRLLLVASENNIDGSLGESTDLGAPQPKVVCDKFILVGQGTTKHADVVRLGDPYVSKSPLITSALESRGKVDVHIERQRHLPPPTTLRSDYSRQQVSDPPKY